MKHIRTLLPFLTLCLLPIEAFAIDMEYYAPNGLVVVTSAFQRLALIFSDTNYYILLTIVTMVGSLIALIHAGAIKSFTSPEQATGGLVNWILSLVVGFIILTSLIIPKATLHVYDPVRNDTMSVPDIPQGIVLLVGLVNAIERNLVEIVDTSTINPYSENADGINIKVFLDAIESAKNSPKYLLREDIKNYYEECGKISMALGGVTYEEFLTNMNSPYQTMSQWTHPSIWLDIYGDQRIPSNMTCTDAWNNVLSPKLNTTNFISEVDLTCSKNDFNNNPIQKNACNNLVAQGNDIHGVSSNSAEHYIREAFIANSLLEKLNSDNYSEAQEALIGRQLTLQGLGSLKATETTQPQLRANMMAIALGIIVFLTLFIATPLWAKALKFAAGSILWIATWGVTMAIAHAGVVDSAEAVLSSIAAGKMGLESFLLAETDGVKAFLLFGEMQENSLMMATAISVAIYGFGSYAMTGMAQSLSSNMGRIGEQATQSSITTEGRAGLRQGLASGLADASVVNGIPNGGYSGAISKAHYDAGVSAQTGETLANGPGVAQQATISAASAAGNIAGSNIALTQAAEHNNNTPLEQATTTATTQTTQQQMDATSLKTTQENLGGGNTVAGAAKISEFNQGQQETQITQQEVISNITGADESLREQGMNKVYGDGTSKALTGEEIRNTPEIYSNMKPGAQDYINNNPEQTFQTHLWTNSDGELAGFRVGNQETVNLDKSFNQQDNENINKRDNLQTGTNILSGETTTTDNTVNHREGIRVENKDTKDTRDTNYSGSETITGDKATLDNTKSSITGSTYINKDVIDTEDSYRGGDALDGKMVDVAFDNINSTEFMAVNKVNQEATTQGIDSQSSKSLEAAMVHNWEARGVSMNESITDRNSAQTSESASAGINSKNNLIGGIISNFIGVSAGASFEARATQESQDAEYQQFNSLNSVAREFITAANGDTEKLAQMSNEFERQLREKADEAVDYDRNAASSMANDAQKEAFTVDSKNRTKHDTDNIGGA